MIYGDRPASSPQPAYSDRNDSRIPGASIVYPNDDRAGLLRVLKRNLIGHL